MRYDLGQAFFRLCHSMRVRSFLVVAGCLLLLLGVFYVAARALLDGFVPANEQLMARTLLTGVVGVIGIIGVLLTIPMVGLLNRIVVYPILRMTRSLRSMSENPVVAEARRLKWSGDDEFAQLAVSVNTMLDAIVRQGEAVRVSEEQKKAILRSMPDALAVFGRHGRLVSLDKQPEGVGPVPGLAVGRGLDVDIWGDEGVYSFNEALDVAFLSGSLGHVHLMTYEGDGGLENRHFDVRVSRVGGSFALVIFRDITAFVHEQRRLVEAQAQLARDRQQASLATMAAGIAHDVNNILSVIINTVEIAWVDQLEGNSFSFQAVDAIRTAVRRGSTLTRELMTFSGMGRIVLRRVSANEVVQELRRLAAQFVPRDVTVEFCVSEKLPELSVDMDQLWNAFLNLFKNAVEAMERKGYLAVWAEPYDFTAVVSSRFKFDHAFRPSSGVLFTVMDSGPGISSARLERIFEPYVSSKSGAHGLGLANVASIVNAHDGALSVRSELGHGSAFSIYLPAAAATPSPERDTDGGTCLVVDDDEMVLRTTEVLLRTLKVTARVARKRAEALSFIRHQQSKELVCAIFDAHFGEGDVTFLISTLRASAPQVPIVITSGSSQEEIARDFSRLDYDLFLSKPFTRDDLKNLLASAASLERPPVWN